jgi:hypothetical protein
MIINNFLHQNLWGLGVEDLPLTDENGTILEVIGLL